MKNSGILFGCTGLSVACMIILSAIAAETTAYTETPDFKVNVNDSGSSSYLFSSNLSPSLASNGDTSFAVWTSANLIGPRYIYGKFLGEGENDIFRISTDGFGAAGGSPMVASNGDNYLVTWIGSNPDDILMGDNTQAVYGQFYNADGSVEGTSFRIDTGRSMMNDTAKVSIATAGTDYFVTFDRATCGDQFEDYHWDLTGRIINGSTKSFKTDYLVLEGENNEEINGAIASNGQNYFLVYHDIVSSSNWDLTGKYLDLNGNPVYTPGDPNQGEFRINTYTTNFQCNPSIATDGENYIVGWHSSHYETSYTTQDGSGYGVIARLIDANGNFATGELLINTFTTGSQQYVQIASSGEDYLLVWFSEGQDGHYFGVYGQLLSLTGEKIGEEFKINDYTTGYQRYPNIAYNGKDYVVIWSDGRPMTLPDSNYRFDIYGTIYEGENQTPIPEPLSVITLFVGLAGLRFIRKKK